MSEPTDTEKELLLEVKCLVLDLNATLEVLDLNLYNGTGLAPSGRQALALIRRYDPDWEAFSSLDTLLGKVDAVPRAKNSRVKRVNKQRCEASKKVLQLDVKRIAQELGRLPNREEVAERSQYPIDYFDRYFISWGEVCAAARTTGMSELPPDDKEATKQPELQLALL
ncbi:MAG: hypothetical protein JO250_09105 [Armatimonadetes bacterium]|nr:hypothetical protein [Armatimonadota bacterium]